MDRDCSHCGCHHADIKFKSRLRRKRCLITKNLQSEIGPSSTKWFDDLTEQSGVRCSTTQNKTWTPAASGEKSPSSGQHSFQAVTPGGATLTPQSAWAMFSTQDTSTPRFSLPLIGISPAFVSTPRMDTNVSMTTDLSRELGGNDSAISWTSSMATPCLRSEMTVDPHDECEETTDDKFETVTRTKGLPRMLFTPDRTGQDSDDFARILEESRDDTLGVHVLLDSSLCGSTSPNRPPPAAGHSTATAASPVLNKRVKKRLSLRAKCIFTETRTASEREELANSDECVRGDGEVVKQVKSDSCEMQNAGLLSPGSTNSVIVSALSPFFDSPASEKRRAAPKGVKRKAAELVAGDDDLQMSFSCGSSPSQCQTGPQSILSSAGKRTVSERKRVRFAADVEMSDKNSRSARKQKAFCSKDVSYLEMTPERDKTEGPDNTASDLVLKIVNLNINNSCAYSERTGDKSSIDVLNKRPVNMKCFDSSSRLSSEDVSQENKAEHGANPAGNHKDLKECSDILLSVKVQEKSENSSNVSEEKIYSSSASDCLLSDQKTLISAEVKTASGDELFSQVSQSALKEMCESANKKSNKADREISDICEPTSVGPSKPVLEPDITPSSNSDANPHQDSKSTDGLPKRENKMFQKLRKFLYPSGRQISHVSPETTFQFHSITPKGDKQLGDGISTSEVRDGKCHRKEDTQLQTDASSNVICKDGSDENPAPSPTNNGSSIMVQPLQHSEQHLSSVKGRSRQRNCIEFKKFSEMFASDMEDCGSLKTPNNQITPKNKSCRNSETNVCSSKREMMNEYDCLKREVEDTGQSVQNDRSDVGFLSADEPCGEEEPEEKIDHDFDMNTQEVEKFVKDAFLDDMEFSQVTVVDKRDTCNNATTTETPNKTAVDDEVRESQRDDEVPNECSHSVDQTCKETDTKLLYPLSADTQPKAESSEHSECLYSVVDEEVAFRHVGSSNINESKPGHLIDEVAFRHVGSSNINESKSGNIVDEEVAFRHVGSSNINKSKPGNIVDEEVAFRHVGSSNINKSKPGNIVDEEVGFRLIGSSNINESKPGHVVDEEVAFRHVGSSNINESKPGHVVDEEVAFRHVGSSNINESKPGHVVDEEVAFRHVGSSNINESKPGHVVDEEVAFRHVGSSNINESKPGHVVDEEVAFRHVGSSNINESKPGHLVDEVAFRHVGSSNVNEPKPGCIVDYDKVDVSSVNQAVGRGAGSTDQLLTADDPHVEHSCVGDAVKDDSDVLEFRGFSGKSLPSFSTASGKMMTFNQTALRKAQVLLECDDNKLMSTKDSFSSVSGKTVKSNHDPTHKAQTALQCKEEDTQSLKCLDSSEESFPSFATASGKPVKYNQDALQKAKHLLECEQNEMESLNCSDLLKKSCPSFSTAGGKTMKLNQSALEKAQALLECEEDIPQLPISSELVERGLPTFSTAGGKRVKINQSALQKAQILLVSEQNKFESLNPNEESCVSFSTASGKAVMFHQNSLQKAQNLLALHDDIEALNKSDCTPTASSSVSDNHRKECKDSDDEASSAPSECDTCANTASEIDHSKTNTNKINMAVKNKNSYSVRETNLSSNLLDTTDPKGGDEFEEILVSIVANKKKYATIKPSLISMPKETSLEHQHGIRTISKIADPMLKPKGFRPFKKPKRISVKKSPNDSSTKTAVQSGHDRMETDCADTKQLSVQNSETEQVKKVDTVANESEMSDVMLNEFSHDIFSQYLSEGSCSQNKQLTAAEQASACQNKNGLPLKGCLVRSSVAGVVTEYSPRYSSSHYRDNKCCFPSTSATQMQNLLDKDVESGIINTTDKSTDHQTLPMSNLSDVNISYGKIHSCIKQEDVIKSQESQVLKPQSLGKGFQLAFDKNSYASEKSLQKVLTNVNTKSKLGVIPEQKMSVFVDNQVFSVTKNSCSEKANNNEEICSSGLTLKDSKSMSEKISKQFENEDMSSKQNANHEAIIIQHLHHLLTDETLFEDNINTDSEIVVANTNKSIDNEKSLTEEPGSITGNMTHLKTGSSKNVTSQSQSGLFHTASGKVVTISKASLEHAKAEWKEESNISIGIDPSGESTGQDTSSGYTGQNMSSGSTGSEPTVCFQTASGKAVSVSKESLIHTKNLWEEESYNVLNENALPTSAASLFQTAMGKDVTISRESLDSAKSLLEHESSDKVKSNSRSNLFQTASGKEVTISKASLEHATSLWKEESNISIGHDTFIGTTGQDSSSRSIDQDTSSRSTGIFQTASGKAVVVSKESLEHAKSLWKNESNVSAGEDMTNAPTTLFQTASGKGVSLSKTSLDHAKSLWKDETEISISRDTSNAPTTLFQTASGKGVSISKTSLEHAKSLWKEESNISVAHNTFSGSTGQDSSNGFIEQDNSRGSARLFQTASGKAVVVSKESLEHAKSLWKNESKESAGEDITNVPATLFQTASGKGVSISKASLDQAKSLWKDESEISTSRDSSNAPTTLFQTASGKGVSISKVSLDHAKSLWMNETEISGAPTNLFQTASGKAVTVTKASLEQAKSLWKDDDDSGALTDNEMMLQTGLKERKSEMNDSDSLQKTNSSSVSNIKKSADRSCMFQTALGSRVSVSENALHRAKTLWRDEVDFINPGTDGCDQTAAGTSLEVSCKPLAHAQKILADEQTQLPVTKSRWSTVCLTGSAASVDAVAESLNHISEMFNNDSIFDDASVDSERKENETASGNAVSVCDSALRYPKNMFDEFQNGPLVGAFRGNDNIIDGERHDQPVSEPGVCDTLETVSHSKKDGLGQKWDRTRDVQDNGGGGGGFSHPVQQSEIQGETSKKGLKSTPEVFHTDRWSASGKRFEPLRCENLSKRPSEYILENIVGCRPDTGSSSSFKTPFKKSPFVPTIQKPTSTTDAKRTNAPIFCPKSAIRYIQQTTSKEILSSPVSEKDVPLADCSALPTEEKPSNEELSVVEARKQQEEKIALKKKQKVRPTPGRLAVVKSSCSRYKYSDLTLHTGCSVQELLNMGVLSSTVDVTSETARSYRFNLRRFYPGVGCHVLVGDGAFLVADDEGFAGSEEFYRAFLTMEGVDPPLVTDVWVGNHYRWVVWKLAAYEVAFPLQFAGRSLNPDSVMLQLKYRYDKEIDNCHRSCLKKIMERDDTACKRMILCVSAVVAVSTASNEQTQDAPSQEMFLELTDGWYSIKGKMDGALLEMVERKQIVVGQKLCISGAELGGSEEACSPLEAPESLCVKLSMNSTRPASWDSRLGYQRDPRPLCVSLGSLHPGGGGVGCVDAVVLRVYPVMYMEKVEGGPPIFRTAESEERVQRQFDQRRQGQMEKLYEKIQVQFEQQETREARRSRRRLTRQDVADLQTGPEVWEAVQATLHPEDLHSWLSVEQQQLMEEFQRTRHEQRQQQLQAEFHRAWDEAHREETTRKVTPVLKIRIAGCARRDVDSKLTTLVTIWRPGPDWMDLREGKRYKFFGLVASSAKTRLSSHSVHLTASRKSRIKELVIEENYRDLLYEPKEVWKVRDLQCRIPPNKEFDFVGIVVDVSTNSEKTLDTVHVCDVDGDLIAIRFWRGTQMFGLTDFQEGKVFVGRNLVLKWSRGPGVMSVEACMEVSQFSHTASSQEERRHLDKLKRVVQSDKEGFLKSVKTKLIHLQGLQVSTGERKPLALVSHSGWNTPAIPGGLGNKETDIQNISPECIQHLFSPMDENDHVLQEAQATSPKDDPVKEQKTVLRSKVTKLLAYGSPKPLTPLNSAISPAAFNKFKSPLTHGNH